MKWTFALLLLLSGFTASSQTVINDPNATLRQVKSFNSIMVSGAVDVLLTHGKQIAVAVSAPASVGNDVILTEVEDNILKISVKSSPFRISSRGKLRVYVSYTQLEKINALSASNINFADTYNGDKLSIQLTGACDLKGNFNASKLNLKLTGASDAQLSGKALEVSLESVGASDFKAFGLTTEKLDASLSGASDARITVTGSVTGKISGASNLYIKGNPSQRDIKKSGASSAKFIE